MDAKREECGTRLPVSWLTLVLIAAAFNGGVSVVDKFVVENQIPDPIVLSFFTSTYGMISAIVMLFTLDVHLAPLRATLLAFSSGVAYLVYVVFYFAALGFNDAPVVVALTQISPVFSALWGFLLLDERFDSLTYAGVGIVLTGAVIISLERNEVEQAKTGLRLNIALKLMVVGSFVSSMSQLMLKHALEEISASDGFFWPRLGVFAGTSAMLALPSIRKRLWSAVRRIGRQVNLLIMCSEVMALVAVYVMTLAYSRGPLTLVSASGAVQPLFATLFMWLVNRIRAGTVPDRADRRLLALRLLPLGMIALGLHLLSR